MKPKVLTHGLEVSEGCRRLWTGMAAAVAVAIVAAGVSLLLPGSPDRGGVDLYIAEAPAGGSVTVTTSAGKSTVMPP